VNVPGTWDAYEVYVPEVALEMTVVSASYAVQLAPSIDVERWITYCLMALVPGIVPLQVRVTGLAS
jgi:hypothetical protein